MFAPHPQTLCNRVIPCILLQTGLVHKPLHSLSHLQRSIGLPDIHSGYGFAIGNMAAFDTADPSAVVSPGTCTLYNMSHAYHMHMHMYITCIILSPMYNMHCVCEYLPCISLV